MNRVQSIVFPNLKFGAPEEMYVRLHNQKVIIFLDKEKIAFKEGGKVSFDTYFSSLSVGVWKRNTAVDNLYLKLTGKGRFIVRIGLHRLGNSHKWLEEYIVDLEDGQDCELKLDRWEDLSDGMLYVYLEALSDGELYSGGFFTSSLKRQTVKLGVVITHFNRKPYVVPAIKRIKKELLFDTEYSDFVSLIVVDNSTNLTEDEASGSILIQNKNLGGSGGFTRGLLELESDADFTHCLFMDDDASCEVESIKRTINLLSFSMDKNLSVSGGLLRELEPYRLVEKGANFQGYVEPINANLDMRHVHDLLLSERDWVKPDYGAWWFFCFSIKSVKYYPFPFFVRGDDIRFGLDNKFNICTLNGVSCWGDDFSLKSSPMTAYLDTRNHLLQEVFSLNCSRFDLILIAFKFIVTQLFSYNYESARCCVMALNHFCNGPKFFEENIDMQNIRKKILGMVNCEKLLEINSTFPMCGEVDKQKDFLNEKLIRKLFRFFTLNGYLIPSFFMKDNYIIQNKGFRASFREIFFYKRIVYIYYPLNRYYLTERSLFKFLSIILAGFLSAFYLFVNFKKIKNSFLMEKNRMTSSGFWKSIFL